jgi:hypothetical protein
MRVQATGAVAMSATRLDAPRHLGHRHPSFLPGRLFYVQGEPDVSGIYIGSLDDDRSTPLTRDVN